MTVKTEMIQGVLTTRIPKNMENVYYDGDHLCLQFGTTQEEAARNLGTLDAAVSGLPQQSDAAPVAPVESVVRVVNGVLTFFIPRQHEAVYNDEGQLCVRLGSSQAEVAQKLTGLGEAVAQLPLNEAAKLSHAQQAVVDAVADAAAAEKAREEKAAQDALVRKALEADRRRRGV